MSTVDNSSEWEPFDDAAAAAQLSGLRALLGEPPRRIIDLGCGGGRVLIPLAEQGFQLTGVDRDEAAIDACRHRAQPLNIGSNITLSCADMALFRPPALADAVLCLGNTLMMLTEPAALRDLFASVREMLARDGLFIIDNFPFEYWRDVAEGNWQEGVSDDGSMQLLWASGEPVFALREGDAVDENDWSIQSGDRVQRLWSMTELNDAAMQAGFCAGEHREAGHLIVFRAPPV